jgi:hypothetical protein
LNLLSRGFRVVGEDLSQVFYFATLNGLNLCLGVEPSDLLAVFPNAELALGSFS